MSDALGVALALAYVVASFALPALAMAWHERRYYRRCLRATASGAGVPARSCKRGHLRPHGRDSAPAHLLGDCALCFPPGNRVGHGRHVAEPGAVTLAEGRGTIGELSEVDE